MAVVLPRAWALLGLATLCTVLGLGLLVWPTTSPLQVLAEGEVCYGTPQQQPMAFEWTPALGGDRLAARAIPSHARCPVCGMFPARFPRWAAQIILVDGTAYFFDSPLDLLTFEARRQTLAPDRAQIAVGARYVTHYPHPGEWLLREKAFFVLGSQALGPMRTPDVPAFASQAAAAAFASEQGGRVYQWEDLPAATLATLRDGVHAHAFPP